MMDLAESEEGAGTVESMEMYRLYMAYIVAILSAFTLEQDSSDFELFYLRGVRLGMTHGCFQELNAGIKT